MRNIIILLLRGFILITCIFLLYLLIRFPQTEGRAKDLSMFEIYTDPFILYIYASTLPFFIALYWVFRLLGLISRNKLYTTGAKAAIKSIKFCAVILSVLIAGAGLFIVISHPEEDDPAGFLVLCMAATIVAVIVAITAAHYEKKIKLRTGIKTGSDK